MRRTAKPPTFRRSSEIPEFSPAACPPPRPRTAAQACCRNDLRLFTRLTSPAVLHSPAFPPRSRLRTQRIRVRTTRERARRGARMILATLKLARRLTVAGGRSLSCSSGRSAWSRVPFVRASTRRPSSATSSSTGGIGDARKNSNATCRSCRYGRLLASWRLPTGRPCSGITRSLTSKDWNTSKPSAWAGAAAPTRTRTPTPHHDPATWKAGPHHEAYDLVLLGLAVGSFCATYGLVALTREKSSETPPGMVWIPGGEFTMGTDDPGRGRPRAAGPPRPRGRLLDGRDRRDQRPVPQVRRGHRLRHHGREDPDREEIMEYASRARRRRRRRTWSPGRSCSRPPDHPVDLRDVSAVVEVDARRRLAPPRRAGQHHRGQGRSSGRSRLLVRRRRLRQMGRQAAADRGRVGVRRPRRPGRQEVRLGRRAVLRRASAVQHLPGPLPRQEHGARTASRARRRSRRFRPTATACTTWPATSGSGAATGICPTPTR